MTAFGRFGLASIVVASVIAGACGDPPDKEIQQAQTAIETAGTAGADQYAHEEFLAAQEALKHAHEAVEQRDYRLALNHALDSREHAQTAAKDATDHKAAARAEAQRAMAGATAALEEARAKLKAAEAARAPVKMLAEPRRVIADEEDAVQKARAVFDRGDYLAVAQPMAGATSRLLAAARGLDAATVPPPKRRR